MAAAVHDHHPELAIAPRSRGGNRAPGFFRRVRPTLCYLRLDTCQAALADSFETSQPTVSRVVDAFTDAIVEALGELVPTAGDLDDGEQLIIDGTLLPCWSWHDHRQLCSGKHRTTDHNVQVAVRVDGMLMWVSDPLPGSVHDSRAIRESGVLEMIPAGSPWSHIGDKGYLGLGMLTPMLGELTGQEKENKGHQLAARRRRAGHRPAQDLAHPAHRLPKVPGNPRDHPHGGAGVGVLPHRRRTLMNNPPGLLMPLEPAAP